jgi:predicted neuraminidase
VVRKGTFSFIVLLVFGNLWLKVPSADPPATFAPLPQHPDGVSETAVYESRFVSRGRTASVHCATAVELADKRLRAFWWGGTREGARDVAIYTSVLDPETNKWSAEKPTITRASTQKHLRRYIKKLGNLVAILDPDGRLWMFYVSVSVGGWSGSAINLVTSDDGGETWSPPRRLITTPFLNLSTLVKGPPLLLQDGRLALPVYHEFIGLFSELLRLDAKGRVIHKSRLTRGARSQQPVIVPRPPSEALALMRYRGPPPRRILSASTGDAGYHWSHPIKTSLPNPDAAIACIRLEGGALLLAFNNSETERNDLSLATSTDEGDTWRLIHQVEMPAPPPEESHESSYPYLMRSSNGDFHLLYTWSRTRIKHVRFNHAWLREKMP